MLTGVLVEKTLFAVLPRKIYVRKLLNVCSPGRRTTNEITALVPFSTDTLKTHG
jgi:hypothetical protein